jgi:DNA-binding response OmpR family regulator
LVVLDLNRNGSVGLDALRSIRLKKPDQPVLMLAGANMVEDRVRGLHAGADDFVAKPFEVAELAARIRAVVRRGNRAGRGFASERSETGSDHAWRAPAGPVDLSPKEFSLLELLLRHAGQPVSRAGDSEASLEAEQRHRD